MHILVAEDEAISRRVLTSLLQKWGFEITVAENGEQAWQLLLDGAFNMAILDWMMPGLDGIEVIQRIRTLALPFRIYLILLTGKTDAEDIIAGLQAGADDYVTKPYNHDELRWRIRIGERILDLERLVQEAAGRDICDCGAVPSKADIEHLSS